MTKDEVFKTTMYDAPPENLEIAEQRLQMLYAREVIPTSTKEANDRLELAGAYPSNLIGMVFKDADQFVRALKNTSDKKNHTWKVESKVVLNCGRVKIYAGSADSQRSKFVFMIKEMPYRSEIIGAKIIKVLPEFEQWLDDLNEILEDGNDDRETPTEVQEELDKRSARERFEAFRPTSN